MKEGRKERRMERWKEGKRKAARKTGSCLGNLESDISVLSGMAGGLVERCSNKENRFL